MTLKPLGQVTIAFVLCDLNIRFCSNASFSFLSPDGDDVMHFVWNVLADHGKNVLVPRRVAEAFSK